jgi:hypothetical protein
MSRVLRKFEQLSEHAIRIAFVVVWSQFKQDDLVLISEDEEESPGTA